MSLPVGQKIRGYGLLNEFGEFDFIPEQTGIRQGETKLIKQTDQYTISETKLKLLVHFRLEKKCQDRWGLLKSYIKLMNEVLFILKEYEF